MQKVHVVASAISLSFLLSSCAPAIIGGAAVVGSSVVQEKGISGNITDSQISTKIKVGLYQYDPNLYHFANVSVQNGEVMLTGNLPTSEMQLQAIKISWETKGVKRVIDNTTVAKEASIGLYAKDSWITTQVKGKLLFAQNVQSVNYSIKTVSGNVYLMGVAQDEAELQQVVDIVRNTEGVQKVISYVHMKDTRE